jgi:hypothetical protein
MKKEQREIYQVLSNEVGFVLCSFCKYASFSGGSLCDGDGDLDCEHPLNNNNKSWNFEKEVEDASQMGDCWGFRPGHTVDFIADIVGIALEKGWDGGVTWWQDKKGRWKVGGIPMSAV